MKAEDLMVGDWVRNDLGEAQRVVELREKGAMLSYNDIYQYDDIQPIPLTKEILEKNGFKKTSPDKYYPEPRYIWGIDSGRNGTVVTITIYEKPVHGVKVLTKIDTDCSHDCGINSIHNCDIEYVNQLQHALKLCGIKKEIQI